MSAEKKVIIDNMEHDDSVKYLVVLKEQITDIQRENERLRAEVERAKTIMAEFMNNEPNDFMHPHEGDFVNWQAWNDATAQLKNFITQHNLTQNTEI